MLPLAFLSVMLLAVVLPLEIRQLRKLYLLDSDPDIKQGCQYEMTGLSRLRRCRRGYLCVERHVCLFHKLYH